jgi:hypothetical protein
MKAFTPLSLAHRVAIAELFDQKVPVLVEVRFPRMATSPDWFLCESAAEFDPIWARLGTGTELFLHSVWDLKNGSRPIVLSR